ncbi:MAG TPA: hypothetical protein PLD95_01800 [bacterium]|jgi:hypothetical protein|nr:hypothetical protein [bacterium]HOG38183.1 hypothetical protein [bacterium]HQI03227.1 hypothetical protein [bacterium]
MKFQVKAEFKENLNTILRDCGYHLHPRYENSYIRRLSNIGFYPRWHLYFKKNKDLHEFDLHLDQKKASYKGHTAHSGDYDDENVNKEIKRILNVMSKYI